jgi:hypothetical protein
MTPELLALLGSIIGGTGALLSYWAGWRARDKWGRSSRRRSDRSGNGNCAPLPPAPPYLSAAIAWHDEEAQRAIDTSARIKRTDAELYARFVDPSLGVRWDEGHTQRGNGSGGPTTPKPDITPCRNPFVSDFQQQINDQLRRNATPPPPRKP